MEKIMYFLGKQWGKVLRFVDTMEQYAIAVILILIITFGSGFALGALSKNSSTDSSNTSEEIILANARESAIALNRKYNDLYNRVAYGAIQGDETCKLLAGILQQFFLRDMLNVSKSLNLDCRMYHENGKPMKIVDKDGTEHYSEILPEEIRLIE